MPRFPSLVSSILVLGLIGLSLVMYVRLSADSIATQFMSAKLDEMLRQSELRGSIGEVLFKPGIGFEIRRVRIVRRDTKQELLHVDQMFVGMPTGARELANLEFEPKYVEIHRAELQLNQTELTSSAIQQLLSGIHSEPTGAPVRIRDSAFKIVQGGKFITGMSDLAMDVTPSSDAQQFQVRCVARGDHLKSVALSANLYPRARQFEIVGMEAAGRIDRSLLDVLPIDMRFQGRPIVGSDSDFGGAWRIKGTAAGHLHQPEKTRFNLTISLDDINLVDNRLPARIQNVNGQIRLNDRGISVDHAQGQLDGGGFKFTYNQSGIWNRRDWRLSGRCHDLRYSKKWLNVFPESIKKFCRAYDPAGLFDVQFALDAAGKKQITAQLKDTSFSYERFPYRLQNCIGDVRWIGNRLRYQVKTIEKGQLLEIGGHIDNPGNAATYICNFGTSGRLPIDENLLRSLVKFPAIDRAVRDFRPLGSVSGTGTIEKLSPGPDGKVRKQVRINVHGCDVRHSAFDYPIQQVEGTIAITDDAFRFEDVTGVSGGGRIECNGDWNHKDGLNLKFLCSEVPFDSRLRHALSPDLQSVWDNLRPSGNITFGKVFLNYLPANGPPDIRVHARLGESGVGQPVSSVSINPTAFPFEVNQLSGTFEIGDGVIAMRRVRGKHGSTWMTCAGKGSYSEREWSVSLSNLLAGSVAFEHDLMKALPSELATAIESLDFEGRFNMGGEISFGGALPATAKSTNGAFGTESGTRIDWNLRFDMDQARMMVGLPLDNIFGSLFLNGSYNGSTVKTAGRVAFDSATLYGAQITNIQGPIWIDNKQTLAGKFAANGDKQPASISGTVFDGSVKFDGWLSHESSLPFFVQAVLEDSQLEDAAAELAPHMQEMSGDAFGFIRLRGNAEELHTFQGDGNVHLRNARIHQLPVILALLKILQVKEVNRTAFDSSDVDFSIKGDQIELARIELIGDAISLIGNGYLEWMRYADVNFYSVVGRNRFHIPVLSDLYKAGSQRTLWINVGGPIDNLQTSRKVLPGLNDSIKALFQSSQTAKSISSPNKYQR